ncbi:MAG: glycosyltransferase family 1 protein [Candidatus Chloroheliales bacterium]|nr:MAG: glycosyltransferase family 1 protein [Chloroflexota bacterium]
MTAAGFVKYPPLCYHHAARAMLNIELAERDLLKRIGINGFFWDKPFTGSGQYTRELWRALHEARLVGDELRATMLHPPEQRVANDADAVLGAHYQAQRRRAMGDNLRELWWEQVELGAAARMLSIDLLHSPYMTAPLLKPCPLVVTVHDLIPLRLPEYRGSRLFRLYLRLATAAARRAQLLLTDSQCSRRDIIELLRVPEQQVKVTYLGIGVQYRPAPAEQQAATRAQFGLPDGFIFYIGGFDRRKNVIGLLRAYAAALPQMQSPRPLAIAGKPPDDKVRLSNPALFPDVYAEARRLGLGDNVHWLGQVSDVDKAALYAAAGLFVFPSLYEGFGLDPLEALACGTPLVCSNAASLPEVVGDAGILVDAHDPATLSAAMLAVLNDEARQAELRAKGPPQAARFTWQRTAQATVSAYRQVLGM